MGEFGGGVFRIKKNSRAIWRYENCWRLGPKKRKANRPGNAPNSLIEGATALGIVTNLNWEFTGPDQEKGHEQHERFAGRTD